MHLFLTCFLSFFAASSFAGDGNQVQVINDSVASFQKRFEMIERAQKNIDVEYFIYNMDQAGRLFTQALVKKKLQNPKIKIRILVDASQTVLDLKDALISELERYGINVRYYNSISLLHFKKAQFRNHRKLLAIDGKEAITGGRNIADEYFDMSPEYNFRDRDIWVKGPLVKEMSKSFTQYWTNERTTLGPRLDVIYTPNQYKDAMEAKVFLTETKHDRYLRKEIARVGVPILANPDSQGQCESLTHVSDDPGYQRPSTRKLYPKLLARLQETKKGDHLFIESPYFIVQDESAKNAMLSLKSRGVTADLLTNSLASTDAFYVAANFYPRTSFYQSISNSKMYIFDGKVPNDINFIRNEDGSLLARNAVFGIHSKTYVFSDSAFAIGTFNVDPRSANLNSEMALFCEGNYRLTKFVRKDIQSRIKQSDLILENGTLANGKSLLDDVGMMKIIKYKASYYPSAWFSYLL